MKESNVKRLKVLRVLLYLISGMLLLLGFFIFFVTNWLLETYHSVLWDQIFFHMTMPVTGVEDSYASTFIIQNVLGPVLLTAVLFVPMFVAFRFKDKITLTIRGEKRQLGLFLAKSYKVIVPLLSVVVFASSLYYMNAELKVFSFFEDQTVMSTVYEDHYVDPKTTELTFPAKKRNLIYLYLESIETTYLSKDLGGAEQVNLIPELYQLAKENTSFSTTDKFMGAYETHGVTYTAGAMVAQASGVPIRFPFFTEGMNTADSFLPGLTTIGELLDDAGYNQTVVMGSSASFVGTNIFYQTHGRFKIVDYDHVMKHEGVEEAYRVGWGMQDRKMFSVAKQEILDLAKKDAPFNATIYTIDSHAPDGFSCTLCPKDGTGDPYKNVVRCSSRQLADFVKWVQAQDFDQNTTIVLSGDHLNMSVVYGNQLPANYRRATFNTFINPAVHTDRIKKRNFTKLDMFPTTLASLGVKIKGDRLGLGTNLFSNEQTLSELIGLQALNAEVMKNSKYYEEKFLLLNETK